MAKTDKTTIEIDPSALGVLSSHRYRMANDTGRGRQGELADP